MFSVVLFVILTIGFYLACLYGWMPFLINGIAKRRRGEGGRRQLMTAGIWVALLVAWVVWMECRYPSGRATLFLCIWMGFSAWVPLLIWGIARWWRKKTGGKWMTAGSGVWGLLVASLFVYQDVLISRHYAQFTLKTFDPNTYTGEVATVEFPYTGEGNINLDVYPAEGPPYRWLVSAVDTNRMVIPAGDYERAELSVSLENVMLDFNFDTPFTVAQDEVFTFAGGFPLTASIDAEKVEWGENHIRLDFKMTDSAGNKVSYRSRGKIGFEAVTPEGEHIWRGDFEWG